MLAQKKIKSRSAYFVCILCVYLGANEVFFFEGRVQGTIAKEIKGNRGFGYDPVFIPSEHPRGMSFGEDPEAKKLFSHRAKAAKSLKKFLSEYVDKSALKA